MIKEPDLKRNFIGFEIINKTKISNFLWVTLAKEIDRRSRSNCGLYIFDFQESILLDPYDDRYLPKSRSATG